MIPKIIHQIAPNNNVKWHPLWEKCQLSWKSNFSEFDYKLWNDSTDIDNFVKEHYPEYYNEYSKFPFSIMKIDFARYSILHYYGGIYADMDMFCYNNFYSQLNSSIHLLETFGSSKLEICLMISEKNQDFWIDCMKTSINLFKRSKNLQRLSLDSKIHQRIVTEICGAPLVSKISLKEKYKHKVCMLPKETYNNLPISYNKSFQTKHMFTGFWDTKYKKLQENVIKEIYKDNVLKNKNIEFDSFDFYTDYTNGGFLKNESVWRN